VLSDSKDVKSLPAGLVDPKEAPCIYVLKRNRVGQIVRLTVIELNKEGLIDQSTVKTLLKEAVEITKQQLTADRNFIETYERKVELKRLIDAGLNVNMIPVAGGANPFLPDAHMPYPGAGRAAPNPAHEEYLKQEDIIKKQQLERERK